MTDSQQLLAEYAANRSDAAFRELVRRYIDLVFSTAIRLVGGDSHRAQDVVQMVFLDLARQAPRLSADTMLGGWLHRDTCFVASKLMRGERRRQRREQQAAEMSALDQTNSDFAQVAPVLDEAINELREDDRKAILLRFYERLDLRSVGEALGSSENAAQKRVTRALGELHALLTRRGVALSAAGLAAVLAAGVTTTAPAGLAASVSASALAGCAAAGGIALGILKLLTMTKLKLGVVSALIIGGLGTTLLIQHQSLARLQQEKAALQQQLTDLRAARQTALATVKSDGREIMARDRSELVRLRGEVTALRRDLDSDRSRVSSTNSGRGEQVSSSHSGEVNKLHANIRTEVPSGQTLLTGGWATGSGSRVFVLATPRVWSSTDPTVQGNPLKDQVTIKTRVIEVPENLLARAGLDGLMVEGNESAAYNVLSEDQMKGLMSQLDGADGVKLLSESGISTLSGREAEVQTVDANDPSGTNSLNHTIGLLPVISGDKTGVELTLDAGLTKPRGQTP